MGNSQHRYLALIRPYLLLLFLLYLPTTEAKFAVVYKGIAHDGLEACLADPTYHFTQENITQRQNCREAFSCIMNNIENSRQSILSAGSATLGFIPTISTLLGNRRSDLMVIQRISPFLSFALSVTGLGKAELSLELRTLTSPNATSASMANKSSLLRTKRRFWKSVLVHIITLAAGGGLIWQSYDLSCRAVLSWACWTSFYPCIWLLFGPVQHSLDTLVKLLQPDESAKISSLRHMMVEALKFYNDLLGMIALVFGTAVFAGLTLVSGQNAIKIIAVYGVASMVTRICAGYIMDIYGYAERSTGEH